MILAACAASAVAVWWGARRQQQASAAQVDRLAALAASTEAPAADVDRLDALPPPVARYLRLALPRAREVALVHLSQAGALRTDVKNDRWMTFEAEHLAAPRAIGFLWRARVRVAPLLHVAVRDALVEGRGSGHVSLLSAFPIGEAAGTPEMNSGSLHRFLAEAVWYPTALLPGPALTWGPIDASRALATLTAHGTSVALEFRFASSGEVTGIYTPGRWGTFDGGFEQRPWEGHFRGYHLRDGMLVPSEGDVGWYVDGRWEPVWRGTVTRFEATAAAAPRAR